MILYEQGAQYWHEMLKFNANKHLPGMALHTVEKLRDMLPTRSEAVNRRISSFIARHGPQPQTTA